ncbi:hypothetical protein [Hominenteromicrobium sp.]|uniref:hypothetical protein n=1 Tax=Hominenteromicrobium sp. TaxID=3073581 RepID=UPI003A922F89
MDMQYVQHDTHKANSQAQAGNDCGSAHNTDSGTHGFTTHTRHSYTEGYAYGFTTHIRHGVAHSLVHGVANSIT